jgi:hypothetical protein
MNNQIKHKETLYVIVGGHFELELSSEEINYRAELYLDSETEGLKQ